MEGNGEGMGNMLYLECNSGISGDMAVAALLDLGADEKLLMETLESIPVDGFSVEIGRVKKGGVDCADFAVRLGGGHGNYDSDMEYLHGHETHGHGAEHGHGTGHGHEAHGHGNENVHGTGHEAHVHGDENGGDIEHGHGHRGLNEIRGILSRTVMTDGARKLANRIFDILAEAEAQAHAVPLEEVHFHEVGAVDSIVDIVAASVCIDNLGIRDVVVPKLCEGTGTVRCQHGILPIPVPAVANLIKRHHLPLRIIDAEGEFVTPTGAAIVAAVVTSYKLPESFTIEKIGMGAGKREYERPSILRAMVIQSGGGSSPDGGNVSGSGSGTSPNGGGPDGGESVIWKLESNVDDCSGETLGYVMERLFGEGARDVHYMPVYMKKNRPGWQINVLCMEDDIEKMEDVLFCETTTIGVRRQKWERTVLPREIRTCMTSYGEVQVKVCKNRREYKFYPEHGSIARIAGERGIPYLEVRRAVDRQLYQYMKFEALEKNIEDVICEQQLKIGYRSEQVQLYYPLESLNRLLDREDTAGQMKGHLRRFSTYVEERLGELEIIVDEEDRFCLVIPPQGSDYVHSAMSGNEFLSEFIEAVRRHGCTVEEVLDIFYKYSSGVHVQKFINGDFDYLVYFEDGTPDDHRYCLTEEGEHLVYHRYTKDDYEGLGIKGLSSSARED